MFGYPHPGRPDDEFIAEDGVLYCRILEPEERQKIGTFWGHDETKDLVRELVVARLAQPDAKPNLTALKLDRVNVPAWISRMADGFACDEPDPAAFLLRVFDLIPVGVAFDNANTSIDEQIEPQAMDIIGKLEVGGSIKSFAMDAVRYAYRSTSLIDSLRIAACKISEQAKPRSKKQRHHDALDDALLGGLFARSEEIDEDKRISRAVYHISHAAGFQSCSKARAAQRAWFLENFLENVEHNADFQLTPRTDR